jgi:hypothetical protein
VQVESGEGNSLRILEISRLGIFKALQPETTEWIRWGPPLTPEYHYQPTSPRTAVLARMLAGLRRRSYDLVVLPAVHADHGWQHSHAKVAAKYALRHAAQLPLASNLLRPVLRDTPHIIIDIRDEPIICATTQRLFPRHLAYFKRELDLDRSVPSEQRDRLRPLPLFLPDERLVTAPATKEIDVFFAGSLNSQARADALDAARSLLSQGVRVVVPDAPLDYPDYMQALAHSWIVLSPEGIGWDCYRHYEACQAFSVPVINRPHYHRHLYLRDGEHCFYYDDAARSLPGLLRQALADKPRLLRMAEQGRRHVLAHHTRAALARYMLQESHVAPRGSAPVGVSWAGAARRNREPTAFAEGGPRPTPPGFDA